MLITSLAVKAFNGPCFQSLDHKFFVVFIEGYGLATCCGAPPRMSDEMVPIRAIDLV